MIANKNRMPHVQYPMVQLQHMTEAEATAAMDVAVSRIPPGALIQSGALEIAEAFSAGTKTIAVEFHPADGGAAVALLAATDSTTAATTALDSGLPLRAAHGGWIKAVCVGSDPASTEGDAVIEVNYLVDGRWNEVMPEFGIVPADVAS